MRGASVKKLLLTIYWLYIVNMRSPRQLVFQKKMPKNLTLLTRSLSETPVLFITLTGLKVKSKF